MFHKHTPVILPTPPPPPPHPSPGRVALETCTLFQNKIFDLPISDQAGQNLSLFQHQNRLKAIWGRTYLYSHMKEYLPRQGDVLCR